MGGECESSRNIRSCYYGNVGWMRLLCLSKRACFFYVSQLSMFETLVVRPSLFSTDKILMAPSHSERRPGDSVYVPVRHKRKRTSSYMRQRHHHILLLPKVGAASAEYSHTQRVLMALTAHLQKMKSEHFSAVSRWKSLVSLFQVCPHTATDGPAGRGMPIFRQVLKSREFQLLPMAKFSRQVVPWEN